MLLTLAGCGLIGKREVINDIPDFCYRYEPLWLDDDDIMVSKFYYGYALDRDSQEFNKLDASIKKLIISYDNLLGNNSELLSFTDKTYFLLKNYNQQHTRNAKEYQYCLEGE